MRSRLRAARRRAAALLLLAVLAPAATADEPPAPPAAPPAAGVLPAPAPALGLAAPSLGLGLDGIADWSPQQPFLDVMKSARPWTGHLPGRWGGWDHDDLARGGFLDPAGWPVAIPPGLEGVEALLLTDLPPGARSLAGRYRLTHAGTGTVEVRGRARVVSRRPGEIWFDFTPGEGHVGVLIRRTDPLGTGDHVRDIRVVKQENIPLLEAGAIFNPVWIDRIGDMRLLRFMDWMATNHAPPATWADRPKPSDYTYARAGAPLEIMIALAGEIGADPWFTLPHDADDDYIRRAAELVRATLDPRLRAHVELSNEVWNWQFPQAAWAEAQALARWGEPHRWVEYYGARAAEMAAIWTEVFGEEAEDRLVRVIATQTGWLGLEEMILEAPNWVAEAPGRAPPAAHFDAYAVTGYVGGLLGTEAARPVIAAWLAESRAAAEAAADALGLRGAAREAHVAAHRHDLAVARAAEQLRDGSHVGDGSDTLAHLVGTVWPHQAAVARAHGLDLVMYEGGSHVVGLGSLVEDAELTDFLTHLNYTPEMGAFYETLLAAWRAAGGTLFTAFVDVARADKWGSWGALRHLDDDNPRWAALARFNREVPAWWETRPEGTFLRGRLVRAGAQGATLAGTALADILIGGPGDDLLIGHGGADRMAGGGGTDTVLLPGRAADYALKRTEDGTHLARGPAGTVRLAGIAFLRFAGEPDRPPLPLPRN